MELFGIISEREPKGRTESRGMSGVEQARLCNSVAVGAEPMLPAWVPHGIPGDRELGGWGNGTKDTVTPFVF